MRFPDLTLNFVALPSAAEADMSSSLPSFRSAMPVMESRSNPVTPSRSAFCLSVNSDGSTPISTRLLLRIRSKLSTKYF